MLTSPSSAVTHTAATILCCLCSTPIQANPTNMCANCLHTQVDITAGIPKQVTIFWCRGCDRYQNPPWIEAKPESRELLALCLRKIKGLNKDVKLVDAGFLWTEPHSRRLKVKLTVQKDVNSTILQQTFQVEFIVGNMQCPDCQRSYTEHTWTAVVQVRQHRRHKRTMYMLEQMLLHYKVCQNVLQIKEVADGLDFYWLTKQGANRLIDFLRSSLPVRVNMGKKLVSQDDNNNTRKYKYSTLVEIVPTAREDLIAISKRTMHAIGGVSPLMLCYRVSNTVNLVDPISLKTTELSAERYWNDQPRIVLTSDNLVEFVVLDIELQGERPWETNTKAAGSKSTQGHGGLTAFNKQNKYNAKLASAEVTVTLNSDDADKTYTCMTHLGNILKPGDTCLGYLLATANITEDVATLMGEREFPDVILVRKTWPHKKRSQRRKWKLKELPKEGPDRPLKKSELEREEEERERFMQELEEDPELRRHVTLYHKYETEEDQKAAEARETKDYDDDDDDDYPEVDMDELVADIARINLDEDAPEDFDEAKDGAFVDEEADEDDAEFGPSARPPSSIHAAPPPRKPIGSGRGVLGRNPVLKSGGFEMDDIQNLERE